jgi:hypothetical protein
VSVLSGVLVGLGAAVGFGLHALWDLAHRPGPVEAGEPAWYAAACVGYDVALGAFILVRFG